MSVEVIADCTVGYFCEMYMPAFSAVAISAFTLLLGGRKASSLQKLSGEVLTWLSVWSKCK